MLQAHIYIHKNEFIGSQPLYEFIMQFLIKHQVKSAIAFNGSMGYLQGSRLSRPNELFSFDEIPLLITFIDDDHHVKELLKALRDITKVGYIIVQQVHEWVE